MSSSALQSIGLLWLVLVAYLLIEYVRLLIMVRVQNVLHERRTPLSAGFDRRAWGEFFVGALRREAALGKDHVASFVSSMFEGVPNLCTLTRGDIDKFLRLYVSGYEHIDGEAEQWAVKLSDEGREIIEQSLEMRFAAGDAAHRFSRINHPRLDDNSPRAMLRPMPLVACFMSVRLAVDAFLRFGLRFERWVDDATGFVFWRHSRRTPSERGGTPHRALVFISGLGQGQSFYPHHAYAFVHDPAFRARYSDVCLCELPGVSGVPLRTSDQTYPTAKECVDAMARYGASVLGVSSFDAIGHSAGAFVLSYASRYRPSLFAKTVYAEAPAVFFTHASKSWPTLFPPFDLPRLWTALLSLDFALLSNWVVMSEVTHQYALKNTTWLHESCHREGPSTLEGAMLIMGTDDALVDGHRTAAYFAKHHPRVTVHLMKGWSHGGFWQPDNLRTTMKMLRRHLCECGEHGSPTSVRAATLLGREAHPQVHGKKHCE